jgi:hypothetical protein
VSRTLDRGSTLYPRAIPARRRAPREEPTQTGGWRSTGDVLRDTHQRSSIVAARPRRWVAVVGRRASRHPSALFDGGGGPDETGSGRGRWAAGKTGGGQGGEGRHGAVPDGRAAQRRTGEWGGGSTTRFNSKRSTG